MLLALSLTQGFTFKAHAFEVDPMSISEIVLKRQGPFEVQSKILDQQELQELAQAELVPSPQVDGSIHNKSFVQAIMVADKLIALGEKIYKIIDKGRPVVQTQYSPISILPKNQFGSNVDVMQTENWLGPKGAKYSVSYKNVYGMTVAEIEFTLLFAYGGRYQGKGRYITSAQIIPSHVSASWGFDVSANMKLNSIQNKGTADNPVAAALLNFDYTVKSIMKEERNHVTFYIDGLGHMQMM